MSLTIRNNTNILSSIYKYNTQTSQSINSNKLDNIPSEKSNNSSKVSTAKYGDDYQQTLIEDKKLYDKIKNRDDLKGIEFGSPEWNKWKVDHNNNAFPPLDAPGKVRQAFREFRESIPKDDKEAQLELVTQTVNLLYYTLSPKNVPGLPANFQANTARDYEFLLDFDMKRNSEFSEICNPSDKDKYLKSIEFDQKLKNKLHEVLFGL